MAAWQFDVWVVPKGALSREEAETGLVDPASFDEACARWAGAHPPPGYERRLSEMLGPRHEIGNEWSTFGSEDSTRVDLLYEQHKLVEVRMRIDVRTAHVDQIDRLLEFVRDCDGVLLSSFGNLIEPNLDAFWVELQLSPAAHFVDDPPRFIAELLRRRSLNTDIE